MNNSTLTINNFELPVHLGWPEAERQQPQIVRLDIIIDFIYPLKAIETDLLEDTFCYEDLLLRLRQQASTKGYQLIEHLTKEIHVIIKAMLPSHTRLTVNVTKFPPISGLAGGVTFTYSG